MTLKKVAGHSRSPILVPIESSYTTSYTNLPPILHRFQVTVKFSLARARVPHFNALTKGDPCQYLRK